MPTSSYLLALGCGAGAALGAWLQWTGRWTSWARNPAFRGGGFVVMLWAVVFCLCVVASGVLPAPLDGVANGIAALATLPAIVLAFWGPDWASPPWARGLGKDGPDPLDPLSAPLAKRATPDLGWDGSMVQAGVRHKHEAPLVGFEAQLVGEEFGRPSVYQRRGMVIGELTLYPSGLVFAARPDEDRFRGEATLREVPRERITGVRRWPAGRDAEGRRQMTSDLWQRVIPRVRLDTADGPLVFQCRRAKELIAAVEDEYLGATVST
jgi:hypothetical protein